MGREMFYDDLHGCKVTARNTQDKTVDVEILPTTPSNPPQKNI